MPGVREDEAESEEEAVRKQLVKMRESSVSQSVSVALRVSNVKGKLTGRLGTLMYMVRLYVASVTIPDTEASP